jgi:hypothetical protein
MLKVKIESRMLLHLHRIEGLLRHKLCMIILLLVHVKLSLLLIILIALLLIIILPRDSYDFRLIHHFLFPVVFIINVLALFFARVNNFLHSLVFMNVLINSMIFIIMLLVDFVASLEGLDQIVIFLKIFLLLIGLRVAGFAASLAVRLIVLLVVWELMLVLFARMVVTFIVIVTTELIKTIFVKKVTIWVIET